MAKIRNVDSFGGCIFTAPINMKFGTEERTAVPHAKFHVYMGRNVGIQPPKLSKFRILAINFPVRATRLHYFNEIHSVCTRL